MSRASGQPIFNHRAADERWISDLRYRCSRPSKTQDNCKGQKNSPHHSSSTSCHSPRRSQGQLVSICWRKRTRLHQGRRRSPEFPRLLSSARLRVCPPSRSWLQQSQLRHLGLHKPGITIHSLDGSQSSIGLPSGSLSHAKVPMEGYSSVFSITTPLLLRWLRTSPMFFTV